MTFQETPYTELLLFSAVVSASVCAYALQRYRSATRNRESLLYFAILMATAAGWSASYAVGLSEVEYGPKVFWLSTTNLFTVIAPTAWLAFALTYSDRGQYLTRRAWLLLAIEPAIVTLTVLTASGHEFYYYDIQRTFEPGFALLSRELGPIFVLHAAYSYALVVAGSLAFLQFIRLDDETYRGQAVLIVGGSLLPVVSNAVFVLDVLGTGVNLTSVVLGGSGLAFALAIKRYRFFDLAPVARDTVVERMRDGYVVCDADDTIVDNNQAATSLLGVEGDLVGNELAAVLPEVEADVAVATRVSQTSREVTRTVDGRLRYLNVSVTTLDEVDGTLVVLRDITDQRRAERRFQSLIERSSDVITVVDEDGIVDYVSPSIERVLGVDPDVVVGTRVYDLVHPDDRDAMRDAFEAGINEFGHVDRVEYRVLDANGEWRVHEAVGRNLLDDPDVQGVVVNSRDVTERKVREHELESTNERLERFASVVSHDLRNPLNVADGYAELLQERVDHPEVDEIRTSHERMRRIIDDVLALAREDDVVEDRQQVSLKSIAEDAWNEVDTREATLTVENCTIAADRTRLVRAFENLFRNAVEHAGADVTVEVGPLDGTDGFYVVDDGPGFPDDMKESLFQEGVSGDNGTGLGLAIVQNIVAAHEWTIDATDDPTGARFEVSGADHGVLAAAN